MRALICVAVAVLSSAVTSIAFAYLFRFPILGIGFIGPFGGHSPYENLGRQPEILVLILSNWLTWGVMGNFVAIFVAGMLAAVVGKKFGLSARRTYYLAASFAVIPILFIALYDALFPIITLIS